MYNPRPRREPLPALVFRRCPPARWQSGYAADCKSVYAGSIPTRASSIWGSILAISMVTSLFDTPTPRVTPQHSGSRASVWGAVVPRLGVVTCLLLHEGRASNPSFHRCLASLPSRVLTAVVIVMVTAQIDLKQIWVLESSFAQWG